MSTSMPSWSEKALVLLRQMNNFHLPGSKLTQCLRFVIDGKHVGWIPPPAVASELSRFPEVFSPPQGDSIALRPSLSSYKKRSEAVHEVLRQLKEENAFACLRGWREEKYEVMPQFCDGSLMCMERSATSLFGVKRYGVHVNGYVHDETGKICMWLARRSPTKQTYPGRLDNLAAGGLAAGNSVKQTLLKECEEEACIPACTAKAARPVSSVSYTYEDHEGIFPESQFVFDLKLPSEFKPQIGDGEVEEFHLLPLHKVKDLLVSDDFKPNSAMVVLDFLIRHSYVEPDSEPYYQEFVTGLHRSL
nr:uncharacterized protein YJR142W-like [Paramormyrops kingsleyae]